MSEVQALNPGQDEAVRMVVTAACVEMLQACGLLVESSEGRPSIAFDEHEIVRFIGFTGRVSGSLIVATSSKIVTSTFSPSGGSTRPSPADLLDRAGELANQTLGRIKRKFCDRGVDFETSTPTAVNGHRLDWPSPARNGVFIVVLAVGGESVSFRFEVIPPPGGEIFRSPVEPIACAEEGDLLLF